jgi:hypothetical protein
MAGCGHRKGRAYAPPFILCGACASFLNTKEGKMSENKARIVQIRRGTTEQHESFTGQIGEVTMDTDAKTLRVHDGETLGGIALARADEVPESFTLPAGYDFVIETSAAGANPWYRKYQSGWVEQGGYIAAAGSNNDSLSVTLPVEMASNIYSVQKTLYKTVNSVTGFNWTYLGSSAPGTSDTPTTVFISVPNNGNSVGAHWEVKGWAA